MAVSELGERNRLFAEEFKRCQPALSAIGDETRQHIILTLIRNSGRGGLRVGEIQRETNISRTAVSHHLKILKEAQIIDMRRDGTKNYYRLDAGSTSLKELAAFWDKAVLMMERCQHYGNQTGGR